MSIDILSKITIKNVISSDFGKPCITKMRKNCVFLNWVIFIKNKGVTKYTSENKSVLCTPDTLVIIPANLVHTWENIEIGDYGFINFQCDCEYDDFITVKYDANSKIKDKFMNVASMMSSFDLTSRMKCIREVYDILLEAISLHEKQYSSPALRMKLSHTKQYIECNYQSDHSTESLAKIAGLSPSYFRNSFKSAYGISPTSYVHKVRIEKAKKLLSDSHTKISHIATDVGYQDIYDFSRTFKRFEGISPINYRKTYQSIH